MSWARALTVAGAGIVVVGAFLPWIISGSATRNSFTTVRSARALELVDSAPANWVLACWFLVPLVAAAALLLAVLGRRRTLAACGGGLGLITIGFGLLVRVSPLSIGIGPTIAVVGGLVACVGALWLLRLGGPDQAEPSAVDPSRAPDLTEPPLHG